MVARRSRTRAGRTVSRTGTLAEYNARRDFKRTAEPKGAREKSSRGRFVVQKHDATRLHYDLRLEHDGVLKSWAVTRGPSLVAGDKRLAVQTEDHPMKYLDFEGVIPKGEYGGGTMIVWDQGTWNPEGDAAKGLKKGHLAFTLKGKRLKGAWHLVRMRAKPKERRSNWLLIKSDDDAAKSEDETPITETRTRSVKSRRSNAELEKSGALRVDHKARKDVSSSRAKPLPAVPKEARKAILPDFVPPQLARLADAAPVGSQWLHEIKFDGYRIQARIDGGKVALLTRKGLNWTTKFKPVAEALKALKLPTAVFDGEIVVEDESGRSDFSALQAALKAGDASAFVYQVFDLLYFDGRDLKSLKLNARKALLADVLAQATSGVVRFSDHIEADGDAMVRHACQLGLEGVVSKRAAAPYRSGRGKDWVKTKCTDRQELVIAGYVPSSVLKGAIGSLVMGASEKGKLVHVGRVGTGYTAAAARDLMKRLKPLAVETHPFGKAPDRLAMKGVTWVTPELVAEVELRGITADGNIRHAAFKGLREDKDATEVVREGGGKIKAETPAPAFKLTHPDRVYWPDIGLTKAGLADYYDSIADHILPHLVGRPLALVRCPSGTEGQCFFQKHGWAGMPKAIRTAKIDGEEWVHVEDRDGLVGLVQSGVLEIHPWGSTIGDIERPDRIILDLDPGPDVVWDDVVAGAEEARARLKAFGLKSFIKTTGGKGLHVVAPLTPKADWARAKAFTRDIASAMAADAPDRFVATMTKSKRKGRIFVDYLRNGRGSTAIAAFSTRARPGAPVATPVSWRELGPELSPNRVTVETLGARLEHLKRDPWPGFWSLKQSIPAKH